MNMQFGAALARQHNASVFANEARNVVSADRLFEMATYCRDMIRAQCYGTDAALPEYDDICLFGDDDALDLTPTSADTATVPAHIHTLADMYRGDMPAVTGPVAAILFADHMAERGYTVEFHEASRFHGIVYLVSQTRAQADELLGAHDQDGLISSLLDTQSTVLDSSDHQIFYSYTMGNIGCDPGGTVSLGLVFSTDSDIAHWQDTRRNSSGTN